MVSGWVGGWDVYHGDELGGVLALEFFKVGHVGPHEVGGEEVVEPEGPEVEEGGQGTPDLFRGEVGGWVGGKRKSRRLECAAGGYGWMGGKMKKRRFE